MSLQTAENTDTKTKPAEHWLSSKKLKEIIIGTSTCDLGEILVFSAAHAHQLETQDIRSHGLTRRISPKHSH